MNNKKAIVILNEQSKKLNQLELFTTYNWTVETQTYLDYFFGRNSYQSEHFRISLTDIKSVQKKEQIISFLNDCINIITNKGIYKPPTENWFSKLPDWAINLGLPALCFISFGVGILFTNNNNSELRKENLTLKKNLLLKSSDTKTDAHKNLSIKVKN